LVKSTVLGDAHKAAEIPARHGVFSMLEGSP
jgi:hypothetical protein